MKETILKLHNKFIQNLYKNFPFEQEKIFYCKSLNIDQQFSFR